MIVMAPFSLKLCAGSTVREHAGGAERRDKLIDRIDDIRQGGGGTQLRHRRGAQGNPRRAGGSRRPGRPSRAVYLCTTLDFPLC